MDAAYGYTCSASLSKWEEVLARVLARLEQGEFAPGDRFPTLVELCAQYGVSNITGRRVFRELQDRGMIASDGRRGTVVTFAGQAQTVYLCYRDECFRDGREALGNWWIHHELLLGLASSDASSLFDFKPVPLQFCLSHLDELAGKPVLASADVLLSISPDESEIRIDRALRDLLEKHLSPIYFHGYAGLDGVTSVSTDLHAVGALPVRHLVGRGHRRIALLVGMTSSPWYSPRLQGYLDALHEAGIDFAPELVRVTNGEDPAQDCEAMEQLLALREPPTAVVCINDARALAVLEYCQRHGVRVPEDLAVTGGDNLPQTAFSTPPLTTLDGLHREKGKLTSDLLAKRLRGECIPCEAVLVPPRLIHRQSS